MPFWKQTNLSRETDTLTGSWNQPCGSEYIQEPILLKIYNEKKKNKQIFKKIKKKI